ncbi:quinoprotein dehydrogenase-associated SoxYZ-like carrier [Plastorhodobacter daqingensis]|uniref:Quinoprotein dehydrogenase-associated SoxYZ-like carrier n=1 Tax=Plastorhodobacter daqingensis TaxID=1387281 RepID=A0ABW2ULI3_9RHOB
MCIRSTLNPSWPARRGLLAAALVSLMLAPAPTDATAAPDNPMQPSPVWDDLQYDILGDLDPAPAAGALDLSAPFRAHDPALVPVRLTQPPGAPELRELVLVVDENPAPVAATITLSPAMHPLDLELRVRVERYSNIRAIGLTTEGAGLMDGRFVRATGGCAAPAAKDAAAALAQMGQMRLQHLGTVRDDGGQRHSVKLMLRHPNYSGLQRDQRTLLNIPAHFIDVLEVRQGDDLLFAVEGGISVSEDPVYQFSFRDNGTEWLDIRATDTRGSVFVRRLPLPAAP